METLRQRYERICKGRNDICEHLPILHVLATQCGIVTEFGVRGGNSTTAFLYAQPQELNCYDIHKCPVIQELEKIRGKTTLRFTQGSSLEVDIAETDMLFIDTLHTYNQLIHELGRHHHQVKQWIVLHDTVLFGINGEGGGPGLLQAVNEFVPMAPFFIKHHYTNQNGLMVLERQ